MPDTFKKTAPHSDSNHHSRIVGAKNEDRTRPRVPHAAPADWKPYVQPVR